MPTLELFLHDRRVGTVAADPRDRSRVTLEVDREYRPDVRLSEAFASVQWNLHRLLAGSEIGERDSDANDVKAVNVK